MDVMANISAARINSQLASEAVTQRARRQRANQAADKRATVGPTNLSLAGQLEVALKKRLDPANHNPIPAKQQTAHRCDTGNEPDVTVIVFRFEIGGRGR